MNMEYFEVTVRAIELILVFWLLGLMCKWTLTFVLGEKGAKIIGFIGYTVNFSIKKFLLSKIFRIDVLESNPLRMKFDFEETDRWDVLFTSLVVIPMIIGILLGSLVVTFGFIFQERMIALSIFLFIVGFIIAINSTPTFQDIERLKGCSIKSVIIWFLVVAIMCTISGFAFIPLIESWGIYLAIIVGIVSSTLITYYIPPIKNWMVDNDRTSYIGGTVDLD